MAHGGATAGSRNVRGTAAAVAAGHAALREGAPLLDATVEACRVLEDDGGYNAGRGSHLRLDGQTVEMDAACMTSDGKFGAVACVSDIRNPILAARRVHDTPHSVLVGLGATRFAKRLGLPPREPPSREAVRHALEARRLVASKGYAPETGWRLDRILGHWNYDGPPPEELRESDTVGVVATDGEAFVAAGSTGGLSVTLLGRASDVGMLGAGLYAGPAGAVACTGRGEFLMRTLFSRGVYERLERGAAPQAALDAALARVPDKMHTGAIAVCLSGWGGASNCDMPWSADGSGTR
ncbi:MAG: L-asparaginase / beta-aspartyl-peptidase [Thermoplasmata archaeon]|nr:L-asparaginase / beta-aspartyl-peptidase [Thermoplasmata archaeon]